MRNMQKYLSDFDALPFEKIQTVYRQRKFFENIEKLSNIDSVLEIGCGNSSIFECKKFKINYVIEPVIDFCQRLAKKKNTSDININNCFLENSNLEMSFDLVVISCLLHEVPKPEEFLRKAIGYIKPNGYIYIDVPNANSLHRHFAVATGYLNSVFDPTTTQKHMQQSSHVFTQDSLRIFVENCGLTMVDSAGYFIKPFHHERMQLLVDKKIITEKELDGFFVLGNILGEFASEIYAIARKYEIT